MIYWFFFTLMKVHAVSFDQIEDVLHNNLLILFNIVLCYCKALNNGSNEWLILNVNPKTRFLDVHKIAKIQKKLFVSKKNYWLILLQKKSWLISANWCFQKKYRLWTLFLSKCSKCDIMLYHFTSAACLCFTVSVYADSFRPFPFNCPKQLSKSKRSFVGCLFCCRCFDNSDICKIVTIFTIDQFTISALIFICVTILTVTTVVTVVTAMIVGILVTFM